MAKERIDPAEAGNEPLRDTAAPARETFAEAYKREAGELASLRGEVNQLAQTSVDMQRRIMALESRLAQKE